MILQAIIDVVELCSLKGIKRAVISPGSRNAPLTLAFARHSKIKTYVIPDERSAGFLALGLSQKLDEPIAIICTSGSAVYNYAPAVTEAYYSNTPLVVLTADRPPEWIDQRDGQTIRQSGIFGDHIKGSFELPDTINHSDNLWHVHRIINDAINLAKSKNSGPVHINVPLREPFYPKGSLPPPSNGLRVFEKIEGHSSLPDNELEKIKKSIQNYGKILIVAGQSALDIEALESIEKFSSNNNLPVITDIISNFSSLSNSIIHQDLFLGSIDEVTMEGLIPDLVLTFGKSVISKNLKLFLRKYNPKNHWHIGEAELIPDTFQSLTGIFHQSIIDFTESLGSINLGNSKDYLTTWKALDRQTGECLKAPSSDEFWELPIVADLLHNLSPDSQIHLANSMPVRWANFINHRRNDIEVFSNRGTCGIDGCLSTAVGCALASSDPVIAILGDMAFLYDRNGLWHNYLPDNLRILVINNHGGGIFRLIEGPSQQPELEEFFETEQKLNVRNTVKDLDIEYISAESPDEYSKSLTKFLEVDGRAKLLEVQVSSKTNKTKFEQLKKELRNQLNK